MKQIIMIHCLALAVFAASIVLGTPPDYKSFKRHQVSSYQPVDDDLLRIWVINIGQGDGILIQLPKRFNYDPVEDDDDDMASERIEVFVDGGESLSSSDGNVRSFLQAMYSDTPIIEHTVISHHDKDHMYALRGILNSGDADFESIYHNGLASYRDTRHGFKNASNKGKTVRNGGRGMAIVDRDVKDNGKLDRDGTLQATLLLDHFDTMQERFNNGEFKGIFEDLAEAVIANNDRYGVNTSFQRAHIGTPFIAEREKALRSELDGVEFELLWPLKDLRSYKGRSWSHTINGNSVTFRLKYGDFEMLFPGDHNEQSEEQFLHDYGHKTNNDRTNVLKCDVMKVPHHGSHEAYKPFFDIANPVISVASMGRKGFKSKHFQNNAWEHPSDEVIKWLGGSHRVYCTLIHEKRFKWDDIDAPDLIEEYIENSHILIETDGTRFRVVEIRVGEFNPARIPTVRQTRRGNGTRWIEAKGN